MRQTRSIIRAFSQLIPAFIATVSLAGCTDEKIVFRDREPFNPPPAAALGFLGYFDATAKQTTCGNCHADFQGNWKLTKHASAYSTLSANTHSVASCYGCHTVNGLGNVATGTVAGHDAVKDSAYYDVQCESCHGPGLAHVEGVGQGTLVRPLAKLSMTGAGTCGDCHAGSHHPFAEEWAASAHAEVTTHTSASCIGCHEGRGVIKAWGVDANFAERDLATNYQAITCGVCHDPHGSDNPSQLRFPVTSADPEQNLCMQCHMRRNEPDAGASSPHAPQGAVLLGFAGWRPPGFSYDTARIYGSHATTANPKLCAGCHLAKFTVTDALTGAFSFQATGHLMRPVPCLDATGKPTADKTCAYTETARSWQTCTTAGCHGSAGAIASIFNDSRALMKSFADQLWVDANGSGSLQASPTDAGMLPTVRASSPAQWSNSDNTVTPAEGAEFNARLCGEYGQSNSDNSKGVHNPFLCRALLIATIDYVRSYYGLPSISADVQARMDSVSQPGLLSSMHVSRTPPGR